jgi:hypothetical protein
MKSESPDVATEIAGGEAIGETAARTAYEEMSALSHRIYQADALVATTAAAASQWRLDRIDMQYTLDVASKMLLEIASEVEFVGRRMQWAPKADEARS